MSEAVKNMFSSIAGRYDLANDVLSLGIHRFWRVQAVNYLGLDAENMKMLDVCTGTGDLAAAFSKKHKNNIQVFGVDFVPEMISLAEVKQAHLKNLEFGIADAMRLPFNDSSFDALSISFGIRNVDSPEVALKEFYRVLKPGGKILVLEFGQPSIPGFKQLYNFYSKYLMPWIGGLVSGNRQAYEYLPETSKNFPCRDEFKSMLDNAGFKNSQWKGLTAGIAYLYKGSK